MRTLRLKVTLLDVVPNVVRVVDVPAAVTLPELHDLLQVAVGWTGSHLHQFVVGPPLRTRRRGPDGETTVLYMPDFGDGFVSDDVAGVREADEAGVRLRDLPPRFVYAYDLGDGWEHDVEVLGPGGDRPGLVSGEGNCPPEDCGGVPGYEQVLAAAAGELSLEDADAEWLELLKVQAGQIREFDRDVVDDVVRRAAGVVPAGVRLVLDLVADGVKLTPGGRLPRSLVRRVQDRRPEWNRLGRAASVEEDLLPLSELHDLMRQVGVLRLAKGVLKPVKTVVGPDGDVEVVRRLRAWLPAESFPHAQDGRRHLWSPCGTGGSSPSTCTASPPRRAGRPVAPPGSPSTCRRPASRNRSALGRAGETDAAPRPLSAELPQEVSGARGVGV